MVDCLQSGSICHTQSMVEDGLLTAFLTSVAAAAPSLQAQASAACCHMYVVFVSRHAAISRCYEVLLALYRHAGTPAWQLFSPQTDP